ncbi:3-hydroxybutyrate dehydrogenase [Microbulbifer thermotolerans]|uniref:3-hydroxybutyrate dehydrogenase n=1 Tax=Microbulbifer thermotolerans TaxID=252514 RepID=A0A143HPM1_MICTH|nr:3-hydroxybutyrate dehydrogenase [Microbulbifer thermotolerans]AMX03684.1 3-hydroxybutyrate dehydrogenase [Microbulbifer thermotolerans]MCX2780956.1 3-hydroxybutyrate dehydrogenase [Microbulbifer thermotolerans]MCX2782059.1 3-hydroxybutyrate dehydrogenase [Microbulbifer thermotolerans]MCX2802530.1 3-hydroxybutyrate dehydrogenase [Microbulbifer thermotolerans]MCX2806295.1 3-hydroxybutyrate dehydrogenase [Microbulbifer thermotolerans]
MQQEQKQPVLISGSTSGIGLAIAHRMAGAGHPVMLHGLMEPAQGAQLQRQFREKYAVECGFSAANIASEEGCAQLVAETREAIGQPSILVNNAGVQFTSQAQDFPTEQWHRIIAINLSAAFFLSRELLPGMRENQWGRIINIASVHGLVASEQKAAYCAAKHGLVGLTKVLALENADFGITANAICPGWVETPLIQPQIEAIAERESLDLEAARIRLIGAKQPLTRATAPEAIGELALYLCGDFANTITGASLPVDGGWSAQ